MAEGQYKELELFDLFYKTKLFIDYESKVLRLIAVPSNVCNYSYGSNAN